MKTLFGIAVLAVLLVATSPSFALNVTVPVSKEGAKELGMEVQTKTGFGSNHVIVQLEFKTEGRFEEFSPEGKFKHRSLVELRIGEGDYPEGDYPPVTAPLKEDRSKPGRVVVGFAANRTQLDKLKLRVVVPNGDGHIFYDLRVKDFVEPKKDR